jgi:23S rRNA (adenine2030-N6)-methyltransferase
VALNNIYQERNMPYSHYGKIGDIWKHLPLCSFLKTEKPNKYVETNSANAYYELSNTPEQCYGIHTFLTESPRSKILMNTPYFNIVNTLTRQTNHHNLYFGSPALALTLLSNSTNEFIFFDIDPISLENINNFVKCHNIKSKVRLLNQDSRDGFYNIIDSLDELDFIHFDPYLLFENNNSGNNVFDAFLLASSKGIKCMLWYGYNTTDENEYILNLFNDNFYKLKLKRLKCVEIFLKIIQKNNVIINPGILGCGVLISNLSDKSFQDIEILSNELVSIYKETMVFNNYSGELLKKTNSFI